LLVGGVHLGGVEEDAGGPFTQQGVDADNGNSSGFSVIDVGRATFDPVGQFAVELVNEGSVGVVEAAGLVVGGAGGDLEEFALRPNDVPRLAL